MGVKEEVVLQEVRRQLERLSEQGYQEFNQKLLPGVQGVLGVRLPKLRGIAKQIAKEDALRYLTQMQPSSWQAGTYYEEKMLYGLVIGYAKMHDNQYKEWLDVFVPAIDNWSVCDSCCMTYKWMRRNQEFWWDYISGWAGCSTEFGARFGFVSMLGHFVDEAHIQGIFKACSKYQESYYARMAVAWLVSACFVKFPKEAYAFLQEGRMDAFTHNKSIQKTCESYRVPEEWKDKVRGLKIK